MQFVFYHLSYHLHLSLSTVGDDEVGQGSAFLHHSSVASTHHFLHRSVVVRSFHRLYVVFAIVLFRRFHALEHHAASYRIRTRNVGVVEAFYLIGQFRKLQLLLQFLHQSCLFLLWIELFSLLQSVELILLAVHFAKFEQMFLVASLRNEELCLVQLPLHIERNDDFLGLAIEAFAYFGDSRQQQFAVGFVEFSFVFEGETLVYAAVLHVYVIDKSRTVVLVVDNREHVDVGNPQLFVASPRKRAATIRACFLSISRVLELSMPDNPLTIACRNMALCNYECGIPDTVCICLVLYLPSLSAFGKCEACRVCVLVRERRTCCQYASMVRRMFRSVCLSVVS